MSSHYLRIFQQPKSAILLILGFASGLPLALTSGTLQAWMTVENIDLKTIGFFSLVGQAYVFKFLWSPLMDRYTPPFLGRRRGWLLTTQVLLLLAIAAMGFLEPVPAALDGGAGGGDRLLLGVAGYRVRRLENRRSASGRARRRRRDQRAGLSPRDAGLRWLALWLADRYLGWQGCTG
jgi:PAT family beta-lactamase induction signal transducer AmpG